MALMGRLVKNPLNAGTCKWSILKLLRGDLSFVLVEKFNLKEMSAFACAAHTLPQINF